MLSLFVKDGAFEGETLKTLVVDAQWVLLWVRKRAQDSEVEMAHQNGSSELLRIRRNANGSDSELQKTAKRSFAQ